jgi:tRNA/rRNA methyltransferase
VHRAAIELVNTDETEVIAKDRAARQAWLEARGYRVISMRVADVEGDLPGQLDLLESSVLERRQS